MMKRDLDDYRRQLSKLAKRIQGVVDAVTDETRQTAGGQVSGELSNVPWHLADMASDEYLHDLNATLLNNEEYLADEIRAAQQRLDAGTFGECQRCHERIPEERLNAVPYARYCVNCAEIQEGEPAANINDGRPRSPNETFIGSKSQRTSAKDS